MVARYALGMSAVCALGAWALAGDVVPPEVQQPGTQPLEVGSLESPNKCDNCHGGYSPAIEPAHNWRGSMMSHAGRDPLFWATMAVAEQDYDGAGDLCLRCHSPDGWLGGRSTPTDGSALTDMDSEGVQCDLCHTMTQPDGSEHLGEQFSPFLAHDEGSPPEAYYGSGMFVLSSASGKLGPYLDAEARHQFSQSQFHRSDDFCGTCHDVSNPVVGDLAHNAGTQATADPVVRSGVPGSDVAGKAAFNNFPFQYGVVERTFSEYKAGALHNTLVSDYSTLPADLQGGVLEAVYESAQLAGTGGNYEDGTPRYFTCQTCHMRPVVGAGCNKKGAPVRGDLPLHDLTGGNYWVPDAITFLDGIDGLRLGGGLTPQEIAGLADGKTRAFKQLSQAASLAVTGDTLKVVNHTGHKLISGYPEGRRMWLNVKWYRTDGSLAREDGAYGPLVVLLDMVPTEVMTLLDLHDPYTKVYEAHYGMTQTWAQQLLSLGYAADLPLTFDRFSGLPEHTLGELAGGALGDETETFHFVLNNTVLKDNRIPTYGMEYEVARQRNALPVPADQYGNPGPGDVFNYFDEFDLTPPIDAAYATIDLLYQPTSWEYIQFLYLANERPLGGFLSDEGAFLLDAWLNTGMAAPYVMATTTWGSSPEPPTMYVYTDGLDSWCVGRKTTFETLCDSFRSGDTAGFIAHVVDDTGAAMSGAQIFAEIHDAGGGLVATLQGFSDVNGDAEMTWKVPRKQSSGDYTTTVVNSLKEGYEFDAGGGVTVDTFTVQ